MESQRWRLVITAASASLVTLGAVTAYQTMSRRKKRRQLDLDAARSLAKTQSLYQSVLPDNETENWGIGVSSAGSSQQLNGYDEGLIREQLARNYAFFGEEAMGQVRGGHVVIVGCGGVGSYAALMLARSGVSKIRLIDFDYVTLSSLNRHATALLSDVGTPKVTCVERTIRQVAKWVRVDARIEIWRKDEGGGKLLEGADWVVGELYDGYTFKPGPFFDVKTRVDAIDNIATKVDLLKYCRDHSIKVSSFLLLRTGVNGLLGVRVYGGWRKIRPYSCSN